MLIDRKYNFIGYGGELLFNIFVKLIHVYILKMYHFAWVDQREKQGYI